MRARAFLFALAAAGALSACQTSVGPVHIGEINQQKAFKLAHEELVRRHMEAYADWRAQIADYNTVWVVTYYRPDGAKDGPALVRVSFDKHTEKVVAVDKAD
ncbi:MAG: hypothetical protein JSS35_17220 [Proteobacteria bacterium]|nr:hypothetical protein [Pseudomonadota bacterium]